MLNKFQAIEDKFMELEGRISDPAVMADMGEWQKLTKAHSKMVSVVEKFREYKKARQAMDDAREMMKDKLDEEFRELVEAEYNEVKGKIVSLEEELRVLLLPKDPNDDKNVIVEIRGGAGGDEAALFAGDLFRMYTRYAETQGWRVEMLDANAPDLGGFKEVVFSIEGDGAYSKLKYESGVHRVQRVPTTESSGRIHTSTVTVAVLPEAEEVDIDVSPNDLRIDTYCASGAGGQHVNKTESAVRITHLPTGVVVQCQDEKSQLKNRDKAMRVLRAKLLELAQAEHAAGIAENRKSQVGTGDRSERIRTYNFPQGRVTDHRIGLTLHKLDFVLNGDLDELISALITTGQSEKLKDVE
ncbi:peptide chain release factor 1 [Sporomusa sp.]|jgi:peptide chain release factor 1|uniref:peptide chain release factor 1 n=1 Tax=Sporomusa sp. TaxID=2078658 RepID=UPI002C9A9378|nr:peptide chain release factor 1 [Sporomusa sp.]HWR06845.1 peptide chain release factor 1 [Sporomusa sp.]